MSFLRPAMIPLLTFAPTMSSCVLKRFPRTTGRNFVMSCVNRAFSLTGKILTKGLVALKRHFVLWCARRRWCLWRFASLIPSGCRLPPVHKVRPLKKKLELKDRENRVFEHDSTFFTFRLNNRFSESYFYR